MKNHTKKEDLLAFVETKNKEEATKGKTKAEKKAIEKAIEKEIDKVNELNVIKMIDKELSTTTEKTTKEKVFKNFTLQMAQKEGLIDVEFDKSLDKWIRHSKKYIEIKKVINLNDNLKTFYKQTVEQAPKTISSIDFEKIISKIKKIKIASIFANIAICSASVSFIVPKIQYLIREHRTKTKSAPGVLYYQEKAKKEQH